MLLAPGVATYRNTLGVAYYRAGRYGEAAETLRGNLDAQENWGLAYDLYFLAMCHHRLGDADRAGEYFAWAARWPRASPRLTAAHLEELAEVRDEAAGLLRMYREVGPITAPAHGSRAGTDALLSHREPTHPRSISHAST